MSIPIQQILLTTPTLNTNSRYNEMYMLQLTLGTCLITKRKSVSIKNAKWSCPVHICLATTLLF